MECPNVSTFIPSKDQLIGMIRLSREAIVQMKSLLCEQNGAVFLALVSLNSKQAGWLAFK